MSHDHRTKAILNVDDAPTDEVDVGPRFRATRRRLGVPAGGVQIGASHYRVPPGKAAWPAHYHAGNEEAVYVLSGQGQLRLGDERHPVRAGDWIALPASPVAHQLHNDGHEDLVYLCVSTQHPTDITFYPDSDKVGVFGGAAPGSDPQQRFISGFFRQGDQVPYYDGEL